MTSRREFITVLGGAAAAWPLGARAQERERTRRIGVLMALAPNDLEGQSRLAAFTEAFRQLGWVDGRNVQIKIRWSSRGATDVSKLAAELVEFAPDVILASSSVAVAAVLQQTRTIHGRH